METQSSSDKSPIEEILSAKPDIEIARIVMDCPFCRGLGEFQDIERDEEGYIVYEGDIEKCRDCDGTGLLRVRDFADNNDLSLELAYEMLLVEAKFKHMI